MDYKEIGIQLGSTVIDFIKMTGDEKSEERLAQIYDSQLPGILSTINLSALNPNSLNRMMEGMVNFFMEETEKDETKQVLDQMKAIL